DAEKEPADGVVGQTSGNNYANRGESEQGRQPEQDPKQKRLTDSGVRPRRNGEYKRAEHEPDAQGPGNAGCQLCKARTHITSPSWSRARLWRARAIWTIGHWPAASRRSSRGGCRPAFCYAALAAGQDGCHDG